MPVPEPAGGTIHGAFALCRLLCTVCTRQHAMDVNMFAQESSIAEIRCYRAGTRTPASASPATCLMWSLQHGRRRPGWAIVPAQRPPRGGGSCWQGDVSGSAAHAAAGWLYGRAGWLAAAGALMERLQLLGNAASHCKWRFRVSELLDCRQASGIRSELRTAVEA